MMDSPFRFTNDTGSGGMGGYQGGLGALGQMYQPFHDRLTTAGYTGPWGQDLTAARQQGQHPIMDFLHQYRQDNGHGIFGGGFGAPGGNGAGGGINPGSYNGSGINPGFGQWNQPPHTMPGPFGGFPGTGPQGLMAMSRWQR